MAAADLAPEVGVKPACEALGVSRATFYRRRGSSEPRQPRPTPSRALSAEERQAVLDAPPFGELRRAALKNAACGSYPPDAFEATIEGSAWAGPIAFDGTGAQIDVNTYMALLEGDLAGTGFDVDGGTGWIRMDVPVTPGEPVTISFSIYDVGDGTFDSAVLLDGFEWRADVLTEPEAELVWP